ncbi:MAG TPA: outer membrane beta-barrel protein [Vicinamibacterales bacterium]
MFDLKKVAACFAFMLSVVGTSTATAQQLASGQTEGAGFLGGVTDGGGLTLGGGIHYAYRPRLLFVGELGYLTGGSDATLPGVGTVGSSALSVDLNGHYLFPQSNNQKLTPYLLAGLGILRASASVTVLGATTSVSDTAVGLNIGGGARLQAGPNWGVQPELKVFVSDNSSARFSVGLYYQFGH